MIDAGGMRIILILFAVIFGIRFVSEGLHAQRAEPEVVATVQGDTMYQVIPENAIPAITQPEFVTDDRADDQMADEEPVLGIILGDESRAYSLWQLDAHEIVNDRMGGTDVAVTW